MRKRWMPCHFKILVLLPQHRMLQPGRVASTRTVASAGWQWMQNTGPDATRPCRPRSLCAWQLAWACLLTVAAAEAAALVSVCRVCTRTSDKNWRWVPARRRAWRRRALPKVMRAAPWAPPTSLTLCLASLREWCAKLVGLLSRISLCIKRARKWSQQQGASGGVTGFLSKVCYAFSAFITSLSPHVCLWWISKTLHFSLFVNAVLQRYT